MDKKDITVILVTSVIPSHPETHIVEETIKSIRHHLPDSEIILQIDGLREEQSHRRADYDEYISRMLWKCLHEYENILPIVFDEHSHQSTMMKKTIGLVRTPLMIYIEGDTPLVTDEPIDWDLCIDMVESDKANTIRFYHEAIVPSVHDWLMIDLVGDFLQTYQWSQRPHLSSVAYYKKYILKDIPEKTFIEDWIHGKVHEDYIVPWAKKASREGWNVHKLWIYYPSKTNSKRSYHLDGRNGLRKFTGDDISWGLTEA
jgi:hypothetical protein